MAKKEMHHFGADLKFGPQFFRRDRAEYLAEFDGGQGRKRVGETSVWYLFSREAAAELKAFNPEARVIIMLREPVAMLHSLFHQFCADGNEPLRTFEEALAAEKAGRAEQRGSRQTYLPQALAYRATAGFTEQVTRYFEVFGRDRVKVIIYDDFAANPGEACREALEFLGVNVNGISPNYSYESMNANVNGDRSVRSPLVRRIIQDPLVRGTAIAMRRWAPKPLFAAVQAVGLRIMTRNFVKSPEQRPAVAPETAKRLREEFAPEIKRLSALLGRDLTRWTMPKVEPVPAAPLVAPIEA